ncbi:MAG: KTSC domain-containing protein [Akkermansiaceae bacterium]
MSYPLNPLTLLICCSTLLISCKSPEPPTESTPTTFTDYQSAKNWIKQNHQAETITTDSSFFNKLEYYPSTNNGYLILHLRKGPPPILIYQNISQPLWNNLKSADSKGKFYNENIQGNKTYTLELKK